MLVFYVYKAPEGRPFENYLHKYPTSSEREQIFQAEEKKQSQHVDVTHKHLGMLEYGSQG